jgi:hypothetical protein
MGTGTSVQEPVPIIRIGRTEKSSGGAGRREPNAPLERFRRLVQALRRAFDRVHPARGGGRLSTTNGFPFMRFVVFMRFSQGSLCDMQ